MPRPPEVTVSASVSSGSPVETSSRRSTNFICAPAAVRLGRSTDAVLPGCASAGRNTLGLSVATHGDFAHVTRESSLPAYTGRVATSLSPSIAKRTESAERPTPSFAASRATNSRWRLVTGAKIAAGDSLVASSAAAAVHTSLRYGANAAFSSSRTREAPHSPSCFKPASLALSVSHTASTRPGARRAASPITSAMTFLGEPFRSSSTMHQNALGISRLSLDGLGVFAQRADELFHRGGHVALDDASRRTRGQRLEADDRELRRLGGDSEVGGLDVLDLLLLGAHDALERGIARLVEPLLRGEDGGQRHVEHLEAAFDLTRGADRLAVRVDRFLHDPVGARPAQELGQLRRDRAHVVVDRLAPAQHELRRLLLDHGRERFRGGERVGRRPGRVVQMNRAIAAHREARAERLLHTVRTERDRDDLTLAPLFLDPERLLDRELVVGRDDPRDAGGVDRLSVRRDLHLGGRVRHLLDGDNDLHEVAPS